MKKRDENSESRDFPLAYLITIRAYGTFLHGDESPAVDRHGFNIHGTPRRPQNLGPGRVMKANMLTPPVIFTGEQCKIIKQAIKEVCTYRHYELWAVNARTNHAHAVVSAHCKPEPIVAFKSYSTRKLREARLIGPSLHPWARGRSRRYLWKPHHVARAIEYVRFGQGEDIPSFDD